MNDDRFRTIKIWAKTYRVAKVIAATLGETMTALFHRLVTQEAKNREVQIEDKEKAG